MKTDFSTISAARRFLLILLGLLAACSIALPGAAGAAGNAPPAPADTFALQKEALRAQWEAADKDFTAALSVYGASKDGLNGHVDRRKTLSDQAKALNKAVSRAGLFLPRLILDVSEDRTRVKNYLDFCGKVEDMEKEALRPMDMEKADALSAEIKTWADNGTISTAAFAGLAAKIQTRGRENADLIYRRILDAGELLEAQELFDKNSARLSKYLSKKKFSAIRGVAFGYGSRDKANELLSTDPDSLNLDMAKILADSAAKAQVRAKQASLNALSAQRERDRIEKDRIAFLKNACAAFDNLKDAAMVEQAADEFFSEMEDHDADSDDRNVLEERRDKRIREIPAQVKAEAEAAAAVRAEALRQSNIKEANRLLINELKEALQAAQKAGKTSDIQAEAARIRAVPEKAGKAGADTLALLPAVNAALKRIEPLLALSLQGDSLKEAWNAAGKSLAQALSVSGVSKDEFRKYAVARSAPAKGAQAWNAKVLQTGAGLARLDFNTAGDVTAIKEYLDFGDKVAALAKEAARPLGFGKADTLLAQLQALAKNTKIKIGCFDSISTLIRTQAGITAAKTDSLITRTLAADPVKAQEMLDRNLPHLETFGSRKDYGALREQIRARIQSALDAKRREQEALVKRAEDSLLVLKRHNDSLRVVDSLRIATIKSAQSALFKIQNSAQVDSIMRPYLETLGRFQADKVIPEAMKDLRQKITEHTSGLVSREKAQAQAEARKQALSVLAREGDSLKSAWDSTGRSFSRTLSVSGASGDDLRKLAAYRSALSQGARAWNARAAQAGSDRARLNFDATGDGPAIKDYLGFSARLAALTKEAAQPASPGQADALLAQLQALAENQRIRINGLESIVAALKARKSELVAAAKRVEDSLLVLKRHNDSLRVADSLRAEEARAAQAEARRQALSALAREGDSLKAAWESAEKGFGQALSVTGASQDALQKYTEARNALSQDAKAWNAKVSQSGANLPRLGFDTSRDLAAVKDYLGFCARVSALQNEAAEPVSLGKADALLAQLQALAKNPRTRINGFDSITAALNARKGELTALAKRAEDSLLVLRAAEAEARRQALSALARQGDSLKAAWEAVDNGFGRALSLTGASQDALQKHAEVRSTLSQEAAAWNAKVSQAGAAFPKLGFDAARDAQYIKDYLGFCAKVAALENEAALPMNIGKADALLAQLQALAKNPRTRINGFDSITAALNAKKGELTALAKRAEDSLLVLRATEAEARRQKEALAKRAADSLAVLRAAEAEARRLSLQALAREGDSLKAAWGAAGKGFAQVLSVSGASKSELRTHAAARSELSQSAKAWNAKVSEAGAGLPGLNFDITRDVQALKDYLDFSARAAALESESAQPMSLGKADSLLAQLQALAKNPRIKINGFDSIASALKAKRNELVQSQKLAKAEAEAQAKAEALERARAAEQAKAEALAQAKAAAQARADSAARADSLANARVADSVRAVRADSLMAVAYPALYAIQSTAEIRTVIVPLLELMKVLQVDPRDIMDFKAQVVARKNELDSLSKLAPP